ncbi:MAG: hypothetical protein KGV43_01590 [Arcobacter sp.]|nr:hypothetical protein [Arcobacter sp.]
MYKNILLTFISFFLLSCSSKELNKKEYELLALQNTKKVDLVEKGNVKYIFWATYLNDIEENYEDEKFLLSVYDIKSNVKITNIRLNGKKYISLKKIDKNNSKFKDLIRKNPWGENFLVKFKSEKKDKDLNLSLSGKLKLTFKSKF